MSGATVKINIKAQIIGIANHSILGNGTIYDGIRLKLPNGRTQMTPKLIVPSEIDLVLRGALDSGEQTELWITGQRANLTVYGIRTPSDSVYDTKTIIGKWRKLSLWWTLGSLATSPFGIGIPFLFICIPGWFRIAATNPFTRDVFDRGFEAAQKLASSQGETLELPA